ncbi:sugar transferase [Ilumatobacter sp.]|uniref:sugar transferase n=2 Tax=Ilumatobacter sp. TaxID=1967498 RepID=UPI0037506E22
MSSFAETSRTDTYLDVQPVLLRLVTTQPTLDLPSVTVTSRRISRAIDVVAATILLVVSAPVMAVIALLVKLTSPGPAIFRQQRVGLGGELFEVLKFRTMANGTHAAVLDDPELRALYELNDFKLASDDPRITKIGRFLRRTSLDELPQLVNVLRGQMSLVGVRPLLQNELELRSRHDRDLYVHHRPGLTGLWQIEGRSSVGATDRIKLDRSYLENWSVRSNVKILLRTPRAVLFGHGAH